MILLNPIWLYALAALSGPVVIHLWNVRPGKTLKVGSIALINESAKKSSRSIKLHDVLLLFVRCLLLALLALVLSMPLWQKQVSSSTIKGWVMLPKEHLVEGYQKFKPAVDSLTKAGYEFHYFDEGFAKAKLKEALADTISIKPGLNTSYWSLVQQLDGLAPPAAPVYLFTPGGANHFSGEKPQVSLKLHWQTYIRADSNDRWVEKAYFSNNNNIEVLQGSSSPVATRFVRYTIQVGNVKNTRFVLATDSGRVRIGTSIRDAVVADTSAWRFAIYADRNSLDAGYVKAALASVIQFTSHKAVINLYTDLNKKPARQDWIFWLSAKPFGQHITQNCDNLFAYQPGRVKEVSSWINEGDQSLSKQKVAIYKLIAPSKGNGSAVWADGFNDAVLSTDRQDRTNLYYFYSRFDPAWSDLVWSNDFPKMMLKLIVRPVGPDSKHDRRGMDHKQLLPSMTNRAGRAGKLTQQTDLGRYVWLLLVLIFAAERRLSHQKREKKILKNG